MSLSVRHAALFDKVGTNIMTFNDPGTLVRDHSFARTRNPMYLGMVILLLGLAIALGSIVALAGPIGFFVAADRWYIPFEERRMAATFGPDYDHYRQQVREQTRRLLPRRDGFDVCARSIR